MSARATIFDMDGLLIDSEILWHRAEVEILGGLGVPVNRSGTRASKGMFVAEVVAHWFAVAPWRAPSQSVVVDLILERVGELVETEGRLMPGALRAIAITAERGPLALASSTPTELIERCLGHFALREQFAVVTSAADELYGKPNPAVFLTAAEALRVSPAAAIVLEDSAAGVIAAKAARMCCVAVPVAEELDQPAFAIADLLLSSLEELSEAWLDGQFAQ
jgi:mannitol-1-/sugar-/sorbitol-6-/2-deoxyglucose-6-phosphatase